MERMHLCPVNALVLFNLYLIMVLVVSDTTGKASGKIFLLCIIFLERTYIGFLRH